MAQSVKQYRTRQIAKRYNISVAQARTWFHEGVIPGIQVGKTILFDPVECDQALARYKRPAKGS